MYSYLGCGFKLRRLLAMAAALKSGSYQPAIAE